VFSENTPGKGGWIKRNRIYTIHTIHNTYIYNIMKNKGNACILDCNTVQYRLRGYPVGYPHRVEAANGKR
jgi:hypothetical protein